MSDTPPPPPSGADPNQPPPPTTPYQQQPYQQTPYQQPGQQPGQPPYGAPQYAGAYGPVAPDHPQANTVLILGILGIVVCGVLAPFAWVMGNRVVAEIDASNGSVGGRGNAQAGRICGIIGTALIALGLAFGLIVVIIAVAGASTSNY